jgi:DNA-binding transcriptional LysR family regulator
MADNDMLVQASYAQAMQLNRLDWTLLRSFLAVIDAGSLLGAAKRLGSYQPTLSRHITELESQLGVPLFERTGRGLRPTSAGLAIVDPARAMAQAAQAVESSLDSAAQIDCGSVRMSAATVVANYLMPACVAQLRVRHPGIEIEVVASNEVSNLLRRDADIALRMVQPTQESLVARRIAVMPMGAFASKAYLKRRGRPSKAAELVQHDLVGLDADDRLLQGLRDAGLVLTRKAFAVRCDDQVACTRLVEQGAGIGFMPTFVAQQLKAVERVLPRLSAPALPVWLVVHREIKGNPLIRTVYDELADAVPRLLEGGRARVTSSSGAPGNSRTR